MSRSTSNFLYCMCVQIKFSTSYTLNLYDYCCKLHILDIQGCSAVTGDGLFEGMDWIHQTITGKAVREALVKPVAETAESVTKTKGMLASFYSSVSSYFVSTNSTTSD